MNELSVVRLKDDYVFFQEDEYICVYRKSTKLVMLKLKAGKNAWNDAVKEDLKRPHHVQWLAKQPYWNWLGLLMLKYQDLFEELNSQGVTVLMITHDSGIAKRASNRVEIKAGVLGHLEEN